MNYKKIALKCNQCEASVIIEIENIDIKPSQIKTANKFCPFCGTHHVTAYEIKKEVIRK
jgi:ribosomal protein L33